jgi:hypothetical protein
MVVGRAVAEVDHQRRRRHTPLPIAELPIPPTSQRLVPQALAG